MWIDELWVYPVKSCAGVQLDRAQITPAGLRDDRRWLVVDAETGRFVSQRGHPRMALLRPETHDGGWLLRAPDGQALALTPGDPAQPRRVEVWDDRGEALDLGDEAARWISDQLGAPCRIVELGTWRAMDRAGFVGHPLSAVDSCPVLVITRASLSRLSAVMGAEVEALRFRPNVVLGGDLDPFAEYAWTALQPQDSPAWRAVKPCSRCLIIDLDPRRGQRAEQVLPLGALIHLPRPGDKLYFGLYVAPQGSGALRVGQRLSPEARSLDDLKEV